MHPANERRRYIVTSPLIGWVHTRNDPWNWDTKQISSSCSSESILCHWCSLLEFPYVYFICISYKLILNLSSASAGIKWCWFCVVMHITSNNYDVTNTCALTQGFVPNNHWQHCPWPQLKTNSWVRCNFKHINFNLFQARLINQCTIDKHWTPGNIYMHATGRGKICIN